MYNYSAFSDESAQATLRMICQGKGEPIGLIAIGLIAVQGLEQLERANTYYLSRVGRLFSALLMALSYPRV